MHNGGCRFVKLVLLLVIGFCSIAFSCSSTESTVIDSTGGKTEVVHLPTDTYIGQVPNDVRDVVDTVDTGQNEVKVDIQEVIEVDELTDAGGAGELEVQPDLAVGVDCGQLVALPDAACVECVTDEDCPAAKPKCLLDDHVCVECITSSDCDFYEPICDKESYECRNCQDDSECDEVPGKPYCNASGFCVECISDEDCPETIPNCDVTTGSCFACYADVMCPVGLHCDTDSGKCVECVDDEDCSGGKPVCDPELHVCVGCADNSDCQPPKGLCHPDKKECVECVSNSDCTDPEKPYCLEEAGICSACVSDDECTDPLLKVCSEILGECVECDGPEDCHIPQPVCDVENGQCVECMSDGMCKSAKPRCHLESGYCVECLTDADCPQEKPHCNQLNFVCFECEQDSDCPAERPFCATAFGKCVECYTKTDCPDNYGCRGGKCFPPPNGPDSDNDLIADSEDNCPNQSNTFQQDLDGDGIGDVCDDDVDGDGLPDIEDNCPYIPNPDQTDSDGDGWGDPCEAQPGQIKLDDRCSALGFGPGVTYEENFEKTVFTNWFMPSGIAGSGTPGQPATYSPPTPSESAAHSGKYGMHFGQVSWPSEANHIMELLLCMPLSIPTKLSVWIRPTKVGHCCGPYGLAAVTIYVNKSTKVYALTYTWSYADLNNTKDHYFFFLDEPPFNWQANQWNLLEVNINDALQQAFGITDFSNAVLSKIKIFNHYSNGTPGAFDMDELVIQPVQ